ncbi:MAG: PQQ-dependent sugar dehydrogenase [Bacteroidia bacterium]
MLKLSVFYLALASFVALFSDCKPTGPIQAPRTIESEGISFRVDTVLSGLKVPWGLAFLPNGDILFTERKGDLFVIHEGKLDPKPIAGVPEVNAKGQGGLFDLELHPNYAENGWIYLSYAAPAESGSGSNTAFMRARLKDHTLVDKEVIFRAKPDYETNHHYGGRIEFDNNGYVYLSVGDRGGTDFVQDLTNYRGKIYRLNDDGTIPPDNPFVGVPGASPETFSWGHRNPQGLTLNPMTGEIWETEHGPRGGDELNIIRKGNNYGWPTITYGINYDGTIITKDTVKEGMEQPVIFWRPSIAPCGMDFVTSDKYPGWKNNILVGSMSFRYLERVQLEGDKVVAKEKLLENIGRVRVVRQAPDGYIYLGIEGPGMIVRLIPE